jgi:hypothetical protein
VAGKKVSAMPASQGRRMPVTHTRGFGEFEYKYLIESSIDTSTALTWPVRPAYHRPKLDLCYPFLSGDRREAALDLSSMVFKLPVEGSVAGAID